MAAPRDYSVAAEPPLEHIRNALALLTGLETLTLPALRDAASDIQVWEEVHATLIAVRVRLTRAAAGLPNG